MATPKSQARATISGVRAPIRTAIIAPTEPATRAAYAVRPAKSS